MTGRVTSRRRGVAAALAVVSLLGLVACSDDENADVTDETIQVEDTNGAGSEPGGETGSGIDAELLAEIEERGKPALEPVEGAVTELEIIDEVEGTGAEVQPGDFVTAHYVGVTAATGEEFDSSWDRGEPTEFPLDGVIEGWSRGLVGMKEGGRRTLVIPSEMAYGDDGRVPGALVFTVDLVAVG